MVKKEDSKGQTDASVPEGLAEGSLRAGEFFSRQIWEAAVDAMAISDAEGIVIDANPAYLHLYGYTQEQVQGQSFAIIFPEELREWAVEQYKVIFAGKNAPAPVESIVRRADGSEGVVESRATFLTTEGRRTAMLSTIRDITARKQAEEELRRSQERLRLTMESINDYAIITLDLKGNIVSWNAGAELMFGYTAAEAIGQHFEIIFTPEDRARGAPAHEMEQAFLKGRAADERWHLRKDGLRFYVSGVLSPLHDGTIIGYVKVARDLTEPKKMEEAVRQLNASLEEKVQTRTEQVRNLVTELTMSEQAERRRISHILHDDLQQRLYSLNFQLTTLRHALGAADQEEAMQTLIEMDEALADLIQVTRSLSVDLSPPVLHNDGLAEAIQWLAVQMERQHGLGVVVQVEESIPVPNEDLRVLLFQVIRELLFNIVKHAGVATARVLLTHEKGHIHIEVRDEGNGFDVNVLKAKNTQGLLRIQQRMHLIGGNIEIDTVPGQGTCVTIHSPLRKASGQ